MELLRRSLLACVLSSLIFYGFSHPEITAEGSRAIYRFSRQNAALITSESKTEQSSKVFQLLIGLKSFEELRTLTYREKAQHLINLASEILTPLESKQIQFFVKEIYSTIYEVILDVHISEQTNLDEVKSKIIAHVSKSPKVAFVGEPGVLKVE